MAPAGRVAERLQEGGAAGAGERDAVAAARRPGQASTVQDVVLPIVAVCTVYRQPGGHPAAWLTRMTLPSSVSRASAPPDSGCQDPAPSVVRYSAAGPKA